MSADPGGATARVRDRPPARLGTQPPPAGICDVPRAAENGGPGRGAGVGPGGTGAAPVAAESAAGGNASQPERGVPQVGNGGEA
ncbi:hypothetical protein, partial [Methylobacterium radiotolerans]|uniref:hypothetical protein n=1 Tax=Methylobacterium radiotolerans TaxID=31998 RepID=UPI003F67DFFF